MDWFGIGSIVSSFLKVGGLWAGFAILVIGLLVYWIKERTSLAREEAGARERERQALLDEAKGAREMMHGVMTNHLAHLASSQDSFAAFQNGMIRLQEGMLKTVGELLDQTKRIGQRMDEQHQQITRDILGGKD